MIDRDTVRHVARLARLRLDDAEEARMETELNGILAHIERIQGLDLADVPPTSHVISLRNVLRPDEPRPSLPVDVALREGAETTDDGFVVPQIG